MIEQTLGEFLERVFRKDNPKVRCITRTSQDDIRQAMEFARNGNSEASKLCLRLAVLPKVCEEKLIGDYDLVNTNGIDEDEINLSVELYLANRGYKYDGNLSLCSRKFVKGREIRGINMSRQNSGHRITYMKLA
jgi:hypothetical protein